MEYKAYALMAILLASVASVSTLGSAYAQTGFTVTTDNTEYSTGEDITVSGNVGRTPTGQVLVIQVYNPNDAVYRFDQVPVQSDGSYTYTFRVGGELGVSGEYRVTVSYAGSSANTTFNFTAADGGTGLRDFTLVIDGTDRHTVQYMISGGTLRSLTGDSDTAVVTATITANRAGELTLVFPRDVFDAMGSSGDVDFIVFVDELEVFPEDDFGATARTLVIEFEGGSEQIDIVGTFLVPEFGTIAAIILAVAIVGTIVATTRYSKFSFLPKM